MRRLLFTVSMVGALAASACVGGAPDRRTGGGHGGHLVEVAMQEFAFTPSTVSIPAGERVILRLVNRGKIDHEFMAGRERRHEGGYERGLLPRSGRDGQPRYAATLDAPGRPVGPAELLVAQRGDDPAAGPERSSA